MTPSFLIRLAFQFPLKHLVIFILVAVAAGAMAQSRTTTLIGTVLDPSGKPLPSAVVSLQNAVTNTTLKARSNHDGVFSVDLTPGQYHVEASSKGFATLDLKVTIVEGEQHHSTLRMVPGAPGQVIHVEERSQNADLPNGGVVDARTVSELPSNGRDLAQSATLQAGVSSVKTQPDAANLSSGRGQRGFGAQISISGSRPQENNYLLDGISVNDYANSGPGSVLGLELGADAVKQLSVSTSNYPANYGRSSGGVISAVTQSGTNILHGSVYEFLRNSALDSRNYFDTVKPPFRRNQFGASLGGPLVKDKLFLFANYEALRQSLGTTIVDTVPSPAARSGNLSAGKVQVDPEAKRFLAFYPLPNRGLIGQGDTGIFAFSGQQVTPENYFTSRLDLPSRKKDSLSATYSFDGAETTQPDAFNLRINEIQTQRNVVSVQEHHTFTSGASNAFRFGVNRVVAQVGLTPTALNPLAADTSYGFLPGITSGEINVLGLTDFTGGLNATSTYKFHWTSIQAYDDLTVIAGAHTFRFGGAIERMRDNMLGITNPYGSFRFNSLSDFLTNRPFSLSIPVPGSHGPRDLRETILAAYFEDEVRPDPRLTLNLAARYEASTVPTEVNNRLAALRHMTDPTPHLGNPYFANPTLLNFEPRIGLAWDPTETGHIMVRAGYGIFDVLPLPFEFELLSLFASPYFEEFTPSNLPPGAFPSYAQLASGNGVLRNVYIQPNPRRNYVNQWNLNVALQATQKVSLLVGYVGSRGIHQTVRMDDINEVLPTKTPLGYLWPGPASGAPKLNPAVGRLDALSWKGDSYYNALQTQATIGKIDGLLINAAYTWGKSIDTGSSTVAGDQFANSVSSLPWFDLRLDRGLSDFNVAQTFSAHITYDLLFPGNAGWYLKHWRLNSVFQATTGAPFTPVIGGDPLGSMSTDPYDVPNRVAARGCGNPVHGGNPNSYLKLECFAFPHPSTLLGNLRRNSITGPGLSNLDIGLFKDNFVPRISNSFNIQFRVEAFNVLNHPNFSPPLDHREIFDENGGIVPGVGLIDSTSTPSRQMQLGLKVLF